MATPLVRLLATMYLAAGFSAAMPAAQAALIPVDDPVLGPDALVLDTSTDLEWLNFRFTTNRSGRELEPELALGGAFAGFRYAGRAEVCALFLEASLPNCNGISRDLAAREAFIQLFSFPGAGTSDPGSGPAPSGLVTTTGISSVSQCGGEMCFDVETEFFPYPRPALPYLGTFLVRPTAVPEPGSLLLLGGWIIGFGLFRAGRQQASRRPGE